MKPDHMAVPKTPVAPALQAAPPEGAAPMAQVVDRNIQVLIARQKEARARRTFNDRFADGMTAFAGSMAFVYIHLLVFGAWILINVGVLPLPRFDPSLVILAMAASVEAIFLSTFVLITQNRMAKLSQERADLDLQVSLLAEHEITSVIKLVRRMAHKMGVQESESVELNELEKDVAPERVLQHIEDNTRKAED